MPQAVPGNKIAVQKLFWTGILAVLALTACEAIDAEPMPAAPQQIARQVPSASVSQKQPAKTTSVPEIVVTGDREIPEAPVTSTETYNTNYAGYWQESQSAGRKPVGPAPVQYEPTPTYGSTDASFSGETYSVIEEAKTAVPEAPYAPTAGATYTTSDATPYAPSSQANRNQTYTNPGAVPQVIASSTTDFGGTSGLHLASYRVEHNAVKGWDVLRDRYRGYLAGKQARLKLVDIPGKGTFFRLIAGPYSSQGDAFATCESIKLSGDYCALTEFSGSAIGG